MTQPTFDQPNIVLCGVPFSDNLGDGVIATSLKAFFEAEYKAKVTLCDISYRTGVASNEKTKGRSFTVFQRLPSFIRCMVVLAVFSLKYLTRGRDYISARLKGRDACYVGGGQLISDVDLNFPLKLMYLALVAEQLNVPMHVIAVGVGGKWSYLGKKLMGRFLKSKSMKSISVRDSQSQLHLKQFFGLESVVVPDPAMMCSIYDPEDSSQTSAEQGIIGLGVADLAGLNYSSDLNNRSSDNGLEHWADLVRCFGARPVELFTNGAAEDELYLHSVLRPYLSSEGLAVSAVPRFRSERELVEGICRYKEIYAFRLHANIIAASYDRFHAAVVWDSKVNSFFGLQGREEFAFRSLAALVDWRKSLEQIPLMESQLGPAEVKARYEEFFSAASSA